MNRLVGFLRGDTTPTAQSSLQHQSSSSHHQSTHKHSTTSSSSSWWPFNRNEKSDSGHSKGSYKNTKNKNSSKNAAVQGKKSVGSTPQDENYETMIFKLPPADPKLKSETQIRRIRRFGRFISPGAIDVVSLAQQSWQGCPIPYRALVWCYLLGYIPTHTTSAQHNQKRLVSLQRKRTEYAKSIQTSYYGPRHYLSHQYQYPLYKAQEESPELYTDPVQTQDLGLNSPGSPQSDQHCDQALGTPGPLPTASASQNDQNDYTYQSTTIPTPVMADQFDFDPMMPVHFYPGSDFYTTPTNSQLNSTQPSSYTPSQVSPNPPGYSLALQPHAFLSQTSQADKQLLHQIRIDLPRTLTTYQVIQLPQIQAMLERVLYTWAVRHPAASYVQGMNDLCAMVTLIVLEQVMWARVGLSNGYLDVNHYKESVIGKENGQWESENRTPQPTQQTNSIPSSHHDPSQSSYDQPKPHVINRNEDMFQMYQCEKPVGDFNQSFFDIHLHDHNFSWLFYLSELSSKALEAVNTPDDRLLHEFMGTCYRTGQSGNKLEQNEQKSKNDQKSASNAQSVQNQQKSQPIQTPSPVHTPSASTSASGRFPQTPTKPARNGAQNGGFGAQPRLIETPSIDINEFTADSGNGSPLELGSPQVLSLNQTPAPSHEGRKTSSFSPNTISPFTRSIGSDHTSPSGQDKNNSSRNSAVNNINNNNNNNNNPTPTALSNNPSPNLNLNNDLDDIEIDELAQTDVNLAQHQSDFLQRSLHLQFTRVPELYVPHDQHIFHRPVSFETMKPAMNQDRTVHKLGSLPSLDLARLVPLYKRITTTYWSRNAHSGQHQPNVGTLEEEEEIGAKSGKKRGTNDLSSEQTRSTQNGGNEQHDHDVYVQKGQNIQNAPSVTSTIAIPEDGISTLTQTARACAEKSTQVTKDENEMSTSTELHNNNNTTSNTTNNAHSVPDTALTIPMDNSTPNRSRNNSTHSNADVDNNRSNTNNSINTTSTTSITKNNNHNTLDIDHNNSTPTSTSTPTNTNTKTSPNDLPNSIQTKSAQTQKDNSISIDISALDDDDDDFLSNPVAHSAANSTKGGRGSFSTGDQSQSQSQTQPQTEHVGDYASIEFTSVLSSSHSPSNLGNTRSFQPQLGIPTTTIAHSISPQRAIGTLAHLLCPQTIATIECDIYWLFSLLIDIVQDNYINKQPGIHRMITKFESLCRKIDPLLSRWLFDDNHVFPIQFAFRWFNCLFVRELPFQYGARLWDVALSNLYMKKQHQQNSQQGQQNQHNQQNQQISTPSSRNPSSSTPSTHENNHTIYPAIDNRALTGNKNNNNAAVIQSLSRSLNNSATSPVAASGLDDEPNPFSDSATQTPTNSNFRLLATNIPHLHVPGSHQHGTTTLNAFDLTPPFAPVSSQTPATPLHIPSHSSNNTNSKSTNGSLDSYQMNTSSKRSDIDIESFEDCFVYFGVSLLTFYRRIFFAGRSTALHRRDDSYDGHNDDMRFASGSAGPRGGPPSGGISVESNNFGALSPVDFDETAALDDAFIEILDTPSIYHYHLSGVPFSVLTNSNGSLSNNLVSSALGVGSEGVTTNNTSSQADTNTTSCSNSYPSILYLPKQLQKESIFGSLASSNNSSANNNNTQNSISTAVMFQTLNAANSSGNIGSVYVNGKGKKGKGNGTPDLVELLYAESACPLALHTMQQELLYNNIQRHHSDCVHNHQYAMKRNDNLTISLQYIDPITQQAITMITRPDQSTTTTMTQISMIGTTLMGSGGASATLAGSGSDQTEQQKRLLLSPHGVAIINNPAFIELGLPKHWALDNFGDIIIFVQQHIPVITQSLWLTQDLETCLSTMYLLQNTFSFQLPNA